MLSTSPLVTPSRLVRCGARLAFVLVVVLALGFARPAVAQWDLDEELLCDEDRYIELFEDYQTQCFREPRPDCATASGCFEIRRVRELLRECKDSVTLLNEECYEGLLNSLVHQLTKAQLGIELCNQKMQLPPPVGCGRICP